MRFLQTAIALLALAGSTSAGTITNVPPSRPDPAGLYLFYLHGKIVEDEGVRPTSPKYGVYEYAKILEALRDRGFTVVSERRQKNTDPEKYAAKVADQIRELLRAGVPAGNVTVVGASKGAIIAMLVSTDLRNRDANFVLLADCNDDILARFPIDLQGNVLSIYDVADEFGQTCRKFFDRATGLNRRREIELELGTGHAVLFRPIPEWVGPAVAWAKEGASLRTAASRAARVAMRGFDGVAAAVDVRTGEVVALAASEPSIVDMDTDLRPLSVAKLWLAASWWDRVSASAPLSVHEMIVGGSDDDGRRLARELRKAAGSNAVVADLRRFGAATDLTEATADAVWADALSLGEKNVETTLGRLSAFLRAVGNDGVGDSGSRVMKAETARRLRAAMLDAVSRGTGREIAGALSGTGWRIGGKTGTGPALGPAGRDFDGWFAGLVVDPAGRPRFSVAAFVRSGGKGGGHAARICAEIARSLAGGRS